MTASEPLEVYETEQSACSYIVEEPTEHSADGLSELSPSVDTDTPVRYTMQEMEAYIQLVRKDRCGDDSLVPCSRVAFCALSPGC